MTGKNGHDIDLLRETAHLLRSGETMGSSFDGKAPNRCDPEGPPPWEYRITFDPATGLYCLEITRPASLGTCPGRQAPGPLAQGQRVQGRRTKGWTHYVNIPATLYEPADVGWRGSEWEDHASLVLAEVFRKLEWDGLPLPL